MSSTDVVVVDNGTGASSSRNKISYVSCGMLHEPSISALIVRLNTHACIVVALQFLKAGYAADNLPRFTYPSIVGRPVLRAEEEAIGDVQLKVRAD